MLKCDLDECSVGPGIPSNGCPISKYLMGCPIIVKVDQSSIHACPDKDICEIYRDKVIKKEIGL